MTFRRALKRLRLKRGDILLADRNQYDWKFCSKINFFIDVSVPVIFVDTTNKNSLKRIPFEDLEKIYLEAKKEHERL